MRPPGLLRRRRLNILRSCLLNYLFAILFAQTLLLYRSWGVRGGVLCGAHFYVIKGHGLDTKLF